MSVPSTSSLFPDISTVRPFAAEAGTSREAVLETVLRAVDDSYAMHGWDQPMQLIALTPSSALPRGPRKRVTRKLGCNPAPETFLAFDAPVETDGYPCDLLAGRRLPTWVEGAVLVTEAWTYPSDVDVLAALVPPSAHPRRVECRTTTLVMRDGALLTRVMRRDGGRCDDFRETHVRQANGRLVDTLLRVIGATTPPSHFRPIHLVVAGMMASLIDWAAATKHIPGTPAIRALAHGLAPIGRLDFDPDQSPISIGLAGNTPISPNAMHQYVASTPDFEWKLLVWTVAVFDSNDCSSSAPEPTADSQWERVRPMWAELALSQPELSWMDPGMYARHTLASSVGSTTFDELLASVAVAFGDCEAEMLRLTLTSVGYVPWPKFDLPSSTVPAAA